MNEATQIITGVLTFISAIITIVLSVMGKELDRMRQRVDSLETRIEDMNERVRKSDKERSEAILRLKKVVIMLRGFRDSVLDIMETSFRRKRPITREQIRRLENSSNIDEILKSGAGH